MHSRFRRAFALSLAVVCNSVPLGAQMSAHAGITERLRDVGVPGMTWALVRGDSVEHGAAGVRDLGTGAPITADTRMQLGSVTKTVLATGVLMLATRGRLDLDEPIGTYLPDLPIDNPWAATTPITVRHLLDHTSGLGDVHLWQVFSQRTAPDLPLRHAIARPGTRLRLQTAPGTRFSYSNTGYLLLGLLIEARTGERYERFLDRELLAPLGMTRSTFSWQTQEGMGADTSMAMGHFEGGTRQASYGIATRPSAQFATTAADMARFARFLMSNGVVNGRVLVDNVYLRAMGRPTTTDAVRAGLTHGYGLGLQSRERWGVITHCHTGNIGTFRAMLCLVPERQRAFFASYNSDPEDAPLDRIDSVLFSQLSVPPIPSSPSHAGRLTTATDGWHGWYVQRPTRFEQFAYLDAVLALTRVTRQGERLQLAPIGGTVRTLVHHDGRLWRLDGRRWATHVLQDGAGRYTISDGQRTLDRVPTTLVWLRWGSAALGALSLIAVLGMAGHRLVTQWHRGAALRDPRVWPMLAFGVLLVGGAGFTQQPFLAIGDPTWASVTVAVGSTLLLCGTAAATVHAAWQRRYRVLLFTAGALQWLVTLAWWELIPLRLWA